MRPDATEALARRVHARVLAAPAGAVDLGHLAALVRDEAPLLPSTAVADVAELVAARVVGLGPLEPLLDDPAVTDVLVNGPGPVWVERGGCLERTAVVLDADTVALLVERIVSPLGLRADRTAPIVDARLPDGSRVHVIVAPLAVDGPCITIRRFGATCLPLAAFCSEGVADLLRWMVSARWNVVISGGTGAGKTTLLNAVAAALPSTARIVTVEDAAELRLPGEHVVRLESRPATADGLAAVTIRQLVRAALRMRPDRIVVGEVRGPEALDMLQAMNTGHEGSLSTCHANSGADALQRIETMAMAADLSLPLAAVREQIATSIDAVVHVVRAGGDRRAVAEVVELAPADGPRRVRVLVDAGDLVASPQRTPRTDVAPPPVTR